MRSLTVAACALAAGAAAFGYQAAPAAQTAAPAKGIIEGQVSHLAIGAPLKKANVRLVGLGGRQAGGMPNMSTKETDEQGRFVFAGLEAGRYNLSAERSGFLRQNYGGRKYATSGTPIPLGQDQHLKDILFKLSPQSVIVGKVLDEDGDPVSNVQVRALKYAYRGGKKQWSPVANGQTSDIGEYRIPNLDPGRYLVSTNFRNSSANMMQTPSNDPLPDTPDMMYGATYYPSTLDSSNAVSVDVGPGGEIRGIDIRLRKTRVFRIRGKVVNAASGRGMVMVMLTPKEGGGPAPGVSPARPPDNRFEIRGVAPGSYVVHAQLGNGNQGTVAFQEVQVSNNHVDGVVLTVAPGNDVPGAIKVEDAAAPLNTPNLSVFLRPSTPMGGAPRARVGDDLKFTLKNVAPLHYSISVSGVPDTCFVKSIRYGGQEVPEDGIDITTGGTIDVTLSATAGEVSGAAVDKEGKPVTGAIMTLIPRDGPPTAIQSRSADEKGGVTFKGLKPGEYRLIAWEDIPPGAAQDPEFLRPFEGRGESVKLDASGKQAVQVKAIPADETDK